MTVAAEVASTRVHIEGYSELLPIAAGADSLVYRAVQDRFGREVAIKVMSVHLGDHDQRMQFDNECRALGRLARHPNVVTVHDAGLLDGIRPYLVMEHCELGSLAGRLERQGPFSVAEVLEVGVKVASALGAAHALGIVHGDIKPANILETEYEPKLADFGIAVVQELRDRTRTIQGLTPVHAAPEVLVSRRIGAEADVYSLASSLYELLAGRPAFLVENGSLVTLMYKVANDPVPDLPPGRRAAVPAEVLDSLRWAMAKDPAERPGSAEAFASHVQSVQRRLGYSVTEVQTLAERREAESRRRPVEPTVVLRVEDVLAASLPPGVVARRPRRWLVPLALAGLAMALLLVLGAIMAMAKPAPPAKSAGNPEAVGSAAAPAADPHRGATPGG